MTFTPTKTGNVRVVITGQMYNQTVADGVFVAGAFGTGTPPVNGAAPSGTNFGGSPQESGVATVTNPTPFVLLDKITGLTLGTTYWFDLQIAAITGGNAGAIGIFATIEEVA